MVRIENKILDVRVEGGIPQIPTGRRMLVDVTEGEISQVVTGHVVPVVLTENGIPLVTPTDRNGVVVVLNDQDRDSVVRT